MGIAALLLIALVPGIVSAPRASAQSDTLTSREFRDLVRGVEADDPAFGPESGDLDLDPDVVTLEKANVDLADLLIEATFTNPYAADDAQFDFGLQFRSATVDGDSV